MDVCISKSHVREQLFARLQVSHAVIETSNHNTIWRIQQWFACSPWGMRCLTQYKKCLVRTACITEHSSITLC